MTYIEHMNQLWRSALLSPMPASEIALFAYLVNESNKRYWKMPFACSTTRICGNLYPSPIPQPEALALPDPIE